MDKIISAFFSVTTLAFCVMIYFITQGFRMIVERIASIVTPFINQNYKKHIYDIWRETILPIAPMVIGALFTLIFLKYPYPIEFSTATSARVVFGIICGGASGYVYSVVRFYVKKYLPDDINKKLDALTPLPPPAGTDPIISPQEPKL